jgi:multiple sugar transport system ATP-binding protein
MDRMPEEMSGGQRQRVAIARALVREPEVFLMDEPLANLDAKLRVHMRTQLQRIHRDLDTTIVYVTHDQAEAMTMSDRIAVIDGGRLQQIDPPLVCYNQPENLFVAGFIGSPAMNFVRGEMVPDGFLSDGGNVEVEFDPAAVGTTVGDRVTLGVRPEDIYPAERAERVAHQSKPVDTLSDVMEPMGDEIFVYLVTDEDVDLDMEDPTAGGQLLMSVEPDSDIVEEQPVSVVFDRSKVHLFDADSEEAIVHGLVDRPGEAADAADEVSTDD